MANRMFYRFGNKHNIWGYGVEFIIVDDSETDKYHAEGWSNDPRDTSVDDTNVKPAKKKQKKDVEAEAQ